MAQKPFPTAFIYTQRWTQEDLDRRPQDYDPEIAARIVRLVENGEDLYSVCVRNRDYPMPGDFLRWTEEEQELGARYAVAVQRMATVVFHMALAEGLSGRYDAQTRMKATQFHAERSSPQKYGSRPTLVVAPAAPAQSEEAAPDQLAELRRKLDAMAARAKAGMKQAS